MCVFEMSIIFKNVGVVGKTSTLYNWISLQTSLVFLLLQITMLPPANNALKIVLRPPMWSNFKNNKMRGALSVISYLDKNLEEEWRIALEVPDVPELNMTIPPSSVDSF